MRLWHGEKQGTLQAPRQYPTFAGAVVLTACLVTAAAAQSSTETKETTKEKAAAPKTKGWLDVKKMETGEKAVKAGDTLFFATNIYNAADIAMLKVKKVTDKGVEMAFVVTIYGAPQSETQTIDYDGKEKLIGIFTVKAGKGPTSNTATVDCRFGIGYGDAR